MALTKTTDQWVRRYYYTSLGKVAPVNLPLEEKIYTEAASRTLYGPIQQILGHSPNNDEFSAVLTKLQSLFPYTPFSMLPVIAPTVAKIKHNNDYESAMSHAADLILAGSYPAVCLVKGGSPFTTYVSNDEDRKPIGRFPIAVGYICEIEENQYNADIVTYLLSMDYMKITDRQCEIMRNIFRIDNNYNSKAKRVTIEIFDKGEFRDCEISPLGTAFPPYALRALWEILPTVHVYSSRHEQAYHYLLENPDEDPELLEYLSKYFTFDHIPTKSTPTSEPEESAMDYERYCGIDEVMQDYVNREIINPNWTVQQAIDYMADENADVPDFFDPGETTMSKWSAQALLNTLKDANRILKLHDMKVTLKDYTEHLKKIAAGDSVNKLTRQLSTAEELVQALRECGFADPRLSLDDIISGRVEPSVAEPRQLTLKELVQQLKSYGFKDTNLTLEDITSGRTEPKKPTLPELTGKLKELGYTDGNLTLDDIISGIKEPTKDVYSEERILALLADMGYVDEDLTLREIAAYKTSHKEDLYIDIDDLKKFGPLHEDLKKNLMLRTDLTTSNLIPVDVQQKIFDALDQGKIYSEESLMEKLNKLGIPQHIISKIMMVEAGASYPEASDQEIRTNLLHKGFSNEQIDSLFNGEIDEAALQNELLKRGFDRDTASEILAGSLPVNFDTNLEVQSSNEPQAVGYPVIKLLLTSIFEKLIEWDNLPFPENIQKRSTLTPLYQNFAKIFAANTQKKEDYEKMLLRVRELGDEELKSQIDNSL